jgi:hypothetical protein
VQGSGPLSGNMWARVIGCMYMVCMHLHSRCVVCVGVPPCIHGACSLLVCLQAGNKSYVGALAYAPPGFLPGLENGAVMSGGCQARLGYRLQQQ